MDHRKDEMSPGMGCLPAEAPLANPYVPFQLDNPPKYNHDVAIVRGTVFPGLDLPFMGKINKVPLAKTPISNLQQLSFYIVDLAEYLDTHCDDSEALELYQKYQAAYQEASEAYQKKFRPMNHQQPTIGSKYNWLDDPWPWEYTANRGV